MLETKNVGLLVDAHAECGECKACRKMHPKTSASCPGQTGVFSTYLCENIRKVIKQVNDNEANTNIGKTYENLLDAHAECSECQTCRQLHPKVSTDCPGQTGRFSDYTCETLRKIITKINNQVH